MSDATDRATALAQLISMVQPTVAPTLTTTAITGEVDVILDRNKRGSRWATATALNVGDVILPTVKNGHQYIVTIAGTTTTEPTWPTTAGSTVAGGATFQEYGPAPSSVYDLRAAVRECWELKAAKASQLVTTAGSQFSQLYEHCMNMAQRFQIPLVA